MTATFSDGVPGLEATHEWTTGHVSGLTATLNDLGATGSRVRLDDITGLLGKADREQPRRSKHGRDGELPGPAYKPGRTITYTGAIEATTTTGLRQAILALESAFEDDSTGVMRLRWDWEDEDLCWFVYGQVIGFDPDERQTTGGMATWPYSRGFTLGIRCDDPLRYWSQVVSATDASGSGGYTVTVTNPGAKVDPIITLAVPSDGDVEVHNATLNVRLKFPSAWGAASTVTIDFKRRLIWQNDVGDTPFVDGNAITETVLTAQSGWWDAGVKAIDRGSNTITATGVTSLAVAFFPGI